MRNDTLLLAVVFEEVKPFLDEYFTSIDSQTEKNFDLLILKDKYKDKIPGGKTKNIVIDIENNDSPAQIRQYGIQYAIKNNYKNIIFTDTDDNYSQNYVESLMLGLENNDFVYSNIVPVDNNDITINNYFSLPHETKRYEQIINYNFIGLGCSAVRSEIIREINIPSDIIAVDWYLYTILLLNGFAGKLVENASVYYRQHYNNTVGGLKQLDRVRLLKGIDIKEKHYRYIYNYCLENNYKSVAKEYEIKYQEMLALKLFLQENINLEKYINTININLNTVYKGWWSEIMSIKEFKKYENTIN
ncbi:MAG: hypothetical protein HOH03_01555 [Candidatus Marinimicrobia bacterium]|nr:hypothetical protein [Candidatus Neomarinimicrobiota bacterium]